MCLLHGSRSKPIREEDIVIRNKMAFHHYPVCPGQRDPFGDDSVRVRAKKHEFLKIHPICRDGLFAPSTSHPVRSEWNVGQVHGTMPTGKIEVRVLSYAYEPERSGAIRLHRTPINIFPFENNFSKKKLDRATDNSQLSVRLITSATLLSFGSTITICCPVTKNRCVFTCGTF
jgi:hypothetical protein